MAARDAELILVQSNGPVKKFKWRPRWFAFLFILLIVLLAGMVVGGYFFYQQQLTIRDLAQETSQLKKNDAGLRAQLHDVRTKLALAEASKAEAAGVAKPAETPPVKPEPKPEPKAEPKPEPAKPQPKPEAKAEPKPPAAPPAKEEAAPAAAAAAQPEPKPAEAAQAAAQEEPTAKAEPRKEKELLPAEPTQSDQVDVRIVRSAVNRGTLTLVYDVVNQQDDGTAEGYVTVVVRGSREDKPWIEANPPMRLSPLGRPLNYRRGTAYSVQRYRRLKASFTVADKTFERLEMLLYSRSGDLLLVKTIDLTEKKGAVEFGPRYVKG